MQVIGLKRIKKKKKKKNASKMLTFKLRFIVSKHQLQVFAKIIMRKMSKFKESLFTYRTMYIIHKTNM